MKPRTRKASNQTNRSLNEASSRSGQWAANFSFKLPTKDAEKEFRQMKNQRRSSLDNSWKLSSSSRIERPSFASELKILKQLQKKQKKPRKKSSKKEKEAAAAESSQEDFDKSKQVRELFMSMKQQLPAEELKSSPKKATIINLCEMMSPEEPRSSVRGVNGKRSPPKEEEKLDDANASASNKRVPKIRKPQDPKIESANAAYAAHGFPDPYGYIYFDDGTFSNETLEESSSIKVLGRFNPLDFSTSFGTTQSSSSLRTINRPLRDYIIWLKEPRIRLRRLRSREYSGSSGLTEKVQTESILISKLQRLKEELKELDEKVREQWHLTPNRLKEKEPLANIVRRRESVMEKIKKIEGMITTKSRSSMHTVDRNRMTDDESEMREKSLKSAVVKEAAGPQSQLTVPRQHRDESFFDRLLMEEERCSRASSDRPLESTKIRADSTNNFNALVGDHETFGAAHLQQMKSILDGTIPAESSKVKPLTPVRADVEEEEEEDENGGEKKEMKKATKRHEFDWNNVNKVLDRSFKRQKVSADLNKSQWINKSICDYCFQKGEKTDHQNCRNK